MILLYFHSYKLLSGECLPGVYLVCPGVKNITILSYLGFLEDSFDSLVSFICIVFGSSITGFST